MKKIIISDSVRIFLDVKKNLFSRAAFTVFPAASNEEVLRIHEAEKADLIITNLEMPGLPGDEMCMLIRRKKALSRVSIIIICSGFPEAMKRASQCKANAVIKAPITPETLFEKAVSLLNIPQRESFRVLISANVEGSSASGSFLCNLVNISVGGMMIETSRKLSKGDAISCSFYLPDSKMISVSGAIVRVAHRTVELHEYGIRFVKLPFETKEVIYAFVRGRTKDF